MTRDDSRPTELSLDVDGLTLAARAWGPAEGAPVLALHGWMDNAATFDRLAPHLPELRIVALDLPGHGRSQHREDGLYEFVGWLPPALGAAEAMGWERFSLLGHSLGGAVALALGGAVPERVERLVSLDALGPLTTPASETARTLGRALRTRRPVRSGRSFADLDEAAEFLALANPALDLAAARTLVARGTEEGADGRRTWRHDPRLRRPSLLRLSEEQLTGLLVRVCCPTLVLRPEDGWPFDRALMAARLTRLRQAELVTVSGTHHAHLVDPAPLLSPLRRFFGLPD